MEYEVPHKCLTPTPTVLEKENKSGYFFKYNFTGKKKTLFSSYFMCVHLVFFN